jgi:hypothetical protein
LDWSQELNQLKEKEAALQLEFKRKSDQLRQEQEQVGMDLYFIYYR